MIRPGLHATAIVDSPGELEVPASTVIEPGCILFGGKNASLRFGEENILSGMHLPPGAGAHRHRQQSAIWSRLFD